MLKRIRNWRAIEFVAQFTQTSNSADTAIRGWPLLRLRALVVAITLLALMPTIVVGLLNGTHANRALLHAQSVQLDIAAHALATVIDEQLSIHQAALAALSSTIPDLDAHAVQQNFAIRRPVLESTLGSKVTLRDPHGIRISPAQTVAAELEPLLAKLTSEVIQSRQPRLDAIIPATQQPEPAVAIAAPVLHDATVIATLDTVIPSQRMGALIGQSLTNLAHPTKGFALLLDQGDHVAAASLPLDPLLGHVFQTQHQSYSSPLTLLSGPSVPVQVSVELTHAPGWHVVLAGPTDPPSSVLLTPLGLSGLTGGFAILLSLGLTSILSRQWSEPLQGLTKLASNIAVGRPRQTEPHAHSHIKEFESLRHAMLRTDAVLRRREAAEQTALQEARMGHELLVSVVNGTAESISVKDLDLRYVLANRAALHNAPVRLAEWEVLGRQSSDLFPPELAQRIDAADRAVLSTGQTISLELDYTVASLSEDEGENGVDAAEHSHSTHWLAMTITPWKDSQGRVVGVVSVSRDVTDRHNAEARLLILQADILRTTRLSAMGAMGSGLAHELNQPLAAATNYLNAARRMLQRSIAGDHIAFETARNAVGEATEQMLRAGNIVRRLRDFVERGELLLTPHHLADLLQETIDLARQDSALIGIDMRLEVEDGIVMIERTQIQQVLLNLIRNAAEAIQQTPRSTLGQIVICARTDKMSGTTIEVRDNGPGIDPVVASRLFEPFVSSKSSGMGIGLAISRTMVEGHGGQITAEPAADGGMVFRIFLPTLQSNGVSS